MALTRIDSGDHSLIQIVDAAMAEAARNSGAWLVCRVGCTQCCMGPFPISQLDARRLRRGLSELEAGDPERASRVRRRARESAARISPTVLLDETDASDDEPCPALDPGSGACDLYAARPITCRTFGPPVRCGSEAVGICELCFDGASEAEIAACEVEVDPEGLESALVEDLEKATGAGGLTIVAFALAAEPLYRMP